MKAQLLIDKDEFNAHIDQVRNNATTDGLWQAVKMLHKIMTTKEDNTKFGETVPEADKALWNELSTVLREYEALTKKEKKKRARITGEDI